MTFTETLWKSTEPLYRAIADHPFNRDLAGGRLDPARFAFYVQQDSLYLRDYARALALLAAKAPTPEIANDLMTYAQGGIAVEQALHGTFFRQFAIGPAERQEPACFAYTQFLLAATALESYEVGLAAVLPCFWIYREVGLAIKKTAASPNPYQAWIDTYSDDTFGLAVQRMLEITEQAAATASPPLQDAMRDAFARSTACEWWFWDAAYRDLRWPAI
ncbi:MAG TPA: TenA family protein [Kiritimatiellia bacterium]|nr:TenA family protein [Kiritimatiellia bacterium]HMO99505.1 TenA family protein [Kiritimatiellia bacterium]HMP97862.1 TenA family protein [Kiritimatiellia bacterium]